MAATKDQHRFQIGARVSLRPLRGLARNELATYAVVAHLPSNGAHFQYRIRNSQEAFERVAAENELVLRGEGGS